MFYLYARRFALWCVVVCAQMVVALDGVVRDVDGGGDAAVGQAGLWTLLLLEVVVMVVHHTAARRRVLINLCRTRDSHKNEFQTQSSNFRQGLNEKKNTIDPFVCKNFF